MYNRELEVREAYAAGERALRSLEDARDSLGSARTWGIFDIFGGGGLSGLIKHAKIGDARKSLARAKEDLDRFGRELSDVREIRNLHIEIGDFLTFADFFFDGFIADMMVQSKIRRMQEEIDQAIMRVQEMLGILRSYN